MRILIATEPRLYRTAVHVAVTTLRPRLQAHICEPDELTVEIVLFQPHLVFCSSVKNMPPGPVTWIVLYPDGQQLVVLEICGRMTVARDVPFDQILAAIDETEHLLAQFS